MQQLFILLNLQVDCRIGSLENSTRNRNRGKSVDCRIGSLEIYFQSTTFFYLVDCRIGSLERILNK